MSKQLFLVTLINETPKQFIDLFPEYIETWRGSKNTLSQSLNYTHAFVELVLIPTSDDGKLAKVYVPTHYILAILDFSEDNPPLGFRAVAQE